LNLVDGQNRCSTRLIKSRALQISAAVEAGELTKQLYLPIGHRFRHEIPLKSAADHLRKPVFGDEHLKRHGKSRQAIGGPRIGFGPVRVAATQRGSLRVLPQ
jgi:hypothetical protein